MFTMIATGLGACGGAGGSQDGSDELAAPEEVGSVRSALTSYTFGIGSGISSSDFQLVMNDSSESYFFGGQWPGNSYVQGTYSDRFTRYPEALWSRTTQATTQPTTVPWLRNAGLFDNEQAWQTWHLDTAATQVQECGRTFPVPWHVTMDYEVDSEQGWDWLVINSTNDNCTGSVDRARVSGQNSGTVDFYFPTGCPSASVTVSYSKDGSVSRGLDMGRIKNVKFEPQIPVIVCPR
jgi:hypothetical protein